MIESFRLTRLTHSVYIASQSALRMAVERARYGPQVMNLHNGHVHSADLVVRGYVICNIDSDSDSVSIIDNSKQIMAALWGVKPMTYTESHVQ